MPAIYRVLVEGKDASPDRLPEGALGAVISDGDAPGELVSFHLALRRDDDWVPIRHPVEEADLRAHGETFASATRNGILFGLDPHICLHCGSVFHVPSIRSYVPLGCSIPLVIGLTAGMWSWLFAGKALPLAVAIGFLSVVILEIIMFGLGELVARIRFGTVQKALVPTECVTCGSASRRSISSLSGKSLAAIAHTHRQFGRFLQRWRLSWCCVDCLDRAIAHPVASFGLKSVSEWVSGGAWHLKSVPPALPMARRCLAADFHR